MSSDNHSIKSNHTAAATTTGGGNNNEESSSINTGATGKSSLTGSAKTVPFRRLSLPTHTNLEDDNDNDNDILYSNHFLPALQVIAHVLVPLRKALIHFHFLCRQQQNPEDTVIKSKIEFQCLATLGQIFQSMMTQPTKELIDNIILSSSKNKKKKKPTTTEDDDDDNDSDDDNSDEDDSDDSDDDSDIDSKLPPIDPTPFYKILIQCLEKFHKPTKPKDATQALQILLEVLQLSCRQIPVTSHLWSALIDQAGLGLIAKQLTVGQCDLEEDGEILQRTKKDSVILWCPWVLPLQPTLPQALQKACSKTKCKEYDFDSKPYDFEVRIPLWQQSSTQKISSPTTNDSSNNSNNLDGLIQDWEQKWDSSSWRTTKSLQLTSLTTFLFLGIDRYNKDQQSINTSEVVIPKMLDVSKLCANNTRTSASSQKSTRSRQYELVAGILVDDEEDYVAIIKNFAITDPDDENSWKLMESEEVIPMTESDVLDFLKGEGNNNGNNKSSNNNEKKNGGSNDDDDDDDDDEGGPCGTVLVYQRCDTGQSSTNEMNQILSDIIISHVSGTLDASPDYYYEEEIIED